VEEGGRALEESWLCGEQQDLPAVGEE